MPQAQYRGSNKALMMTFFRDPLSHLASMYMHCTTWRGHRNKEAMPKIFDDWVQYWAHIPPETKYLTYTPESFYCYDPRSFQTSRINGHGPNDFWCATVPCLAFWLPWLTSLPSCSGF